MCRFWMRKRGDQFPYFRFMYNDLSIRNDYDPEHDESSFYCTKILNWNAAADISLVMYRFEPVFECPGININPYDTEALIQKLKLCLTFC